MLGTKLRYFLILILVICLILIRFFEDQLFYDPFLNFFKSEYQHKSLPEFNGKSLFIGVLFRYGLNTFLSLGLIYCLFLEKKMVVFAASLYGVFFIVLSGSFFMLLLGNQPNYLVLFYVRRFLIQPLFLVLFIPAFYYQKTVKK
ncbi:exosortase F system-associated protein [Flavobacterium sp. J27]|uniref:exosortase F system-associated membrane protein n=1 Tax=Flavobacterium sp. J27 TaxID=2060419 RepID=UPI00102FBF86|nr:exosortase F system-associated protein [Flavobacterium sp. J27]